MMHTLFFQEVAGGSRFELLSIDVANSWGILYVVNVQQKEEISPYLPEYMSTEMM